MDWIKRCNDELKADRPTIDEVEFIPRIPISILVENVRSVHNVGSIFRTADGFGAEKIYLTGSPYGTCANISSTMMPDILYAPAIGNEMVILNSPL